MEDNNYERISLLKCDIEGGEYPFFESVTDEQINLIDKFMIEFHGNDNQEIKPILDKLRRNNYEYDIIVFELGRQFKTNESVEHGVIFAKPKSIIKLDEIQNFSQGGEQKIILDFFKDEDPKKNRFLDIGANDGITFSNTRALALLGWNGVCVEPTQNAFLNLQKLYKDNKQVECYNCGISNQTKVEKIYESLNWVNKDAPQGILSTLHLENKNRFKGMNWSESNILLYTFKDFEEFNGLGSYTYDFINIDVEGHELIVLNEMENILKRCKLLCIERTENENQNSKIENEIVSMGFEIIATTVDNLLAKR